MKRTLSALAAIAIAAAAFVVLAPFAGARSTATTVKVTAKDTLRFTLSRKSAPHGKTIFKVINKGTLRHDFKIAGKKSKLVQPGKSGKLIVTLKAGKLKYLCTVPGHAAAGMKGVLKVT